jgi:hypothetical protein
MTPDARHRVAVLALPGVLPLDFGIAVQTFEPDPHYAVAVCADPAVQPIRSTGFDLAPAHGLGAVRTADIVIVPGYADPEQIPVAASANAPVQIDTSRLPVACAC